MAVSYIWGEGGQREKKTLARREILNYPAENGVEVLVKRHVGYVMNN